MESWVGIAQGAVGLTLSLTEWRENAQIENTGLIETKVNGLTIWSISAFMESLRVLGKGAWHEYIWTSLRDGFMLWTLGSVMGYENFVALLGLVVMHGFWRSANYILDRVKVDKQTFQFFQQNLLLQRLRIMALFALVIPLIEFALDNDLNSKLDENLPIFIWLTFAFMFIMMLAEKLIWEDISFHVAYSLLLYGTGFRSYENGVPKISISSAKEKNAKHLLDSISDGVRSQRSTRYHAVSAT